LFFDLVGLLVKLWPRDGRRPPPTTGLTAVALVSAVGVALLWTFTPVMHAAVTLGGLIDWHTIWYPVLALAPLGLGWSVWRLRPHRPDPGDAARDPPAGARAAAPVPVE